MAPWIRTYSGKRLNPLDPDPSQIDIEDIAHALSKINRFNGHTPKPISVAQHSVWVSRVAGLGSVGLQGLFHDAAEYLLGDVTKWLKQDEVFAGYREAEERVQRAIYQRFELPEEMFSEVRQADVLLVRVEAEWAWGADWSDVPKSELEEVSDALEQLYGNHVVSTNLSAHQAAADGLCQRIYQALKYGRMKLADALTSVVVPVREFEHFGRTQYNQDCSLCRKLIRRGDAIWFRTNRSGERTMAFHEQCFEDLRAGRRSQAGLLREHEGRWISVIINIRGTNGSGKSHIVREVMSRYTSRCPIYVPHRKQPFGYDCATGGRQSLWVPGHYETACGGCDTIMNVEDVFASVRTHAEEHDVLFEGIISQDDVVRTTELARGYPLLVIVLAVPIEVCLASIRDRRLERGDERPLNPQNTIARHRGILARVTRLRDNGIAVRKLGREAALAATLEALGWPVTVTA